MGLHRCWGWGWGWGSVLQRTTAKSRAEAKPYGNYPMNTLGN
jgi:hypothetical protein